MDQKTIARKTTEECWNTGDFSKLDEYMAPNWKNTDPQGPPGLPPGPAGFKALISGYRAAFPDINFKIIDLREEGDSVVARWEASGTMKGPLMGMPPSGKRSVVTGMTISRFEGGKVVEHISNWDTLGMLQQLGFVPKM